MNIVAAILFIFLLSFTLTWLVRIYSLRKAILDIPNERSSHCLPTPRGGGIAIAATFFLAISGLAWFNIISHDLFKALLGGGILIAATGYWDDLKSISVILRAFLHFLAAAWALYCLGGFPLLELGSWSLHLGWFGSLLAVFGIVWLTNLYNFMDGIDGIAGSEALFVCLISGLTLTFLGGHSLALIYFFLFASVLGFLLWNWPPAKIFMGDVGSGLLGFIFAVLAIAAANQQHLSIIFWLTLLTVFVFDATYTLIRRMARGDCWYKSHCEHMYQRLVQHGASHKKVTILVSLVNLFIILPLFCLMLYWQSLSVWLFLLIGLVFWIVWLRFTKLRG